MSDDPVVSRPQIAVYVMTNLGRTVLYVGVTNDLTRRVWEHRSLADPRSFTTRYRVTLLVHYEAGESMVEAIRREKQVKGWTRARKLDLIRRSNPQLRDLWPEIVS